MSGAGLDRVRLELLAGTTPDVTRLGPRAARGLRLAGRLGAPLLPAVEAATAAADDADRARRGVAVSTAQARTVARGLTTAPLLLAPLIGVLAGVDVPAFYATSGGRTVLGAGLVLIVAGGTVARLLTVHAARPARDADVEEVAELLAIALHAGVGTAEALRQVADVLPGRATPLRRLALDLDLAVVRSDPTSAGPLGRVEELLRTTRRLGVPAAPALRRLAADLRAEELARLMAATERLPARLTIPTTLLLLPATLLLVGAPLVASGLSAVLP